jgi:hypothetical protein
MAGAVPNQSTTYYNSMAEKDTGVKIATSNLFIENETVPIDYMVGAIFDDIGGQELINSTDRDGLLRSDGSIIGNIGEVIDDNNPITIMPPVDGTPSLSNEFAINFGSHHPRVGGGKVSRYTQKSNYLTGLTATLSPSTAVVEIDDGVGTIKPGQVVTKTSGTGAFGVGAVVKSVDSSTQITLSVNHTNPGAITFRVGTEDTDYYSAYVDEFETNERVYFSKNQIEIPTQTPTLIGGAAKIATSTPNSLKSGDQILLYGLTPAEYNGQYFVGAADEYSITIAPNPTNLIVNEEWLPITKSGYIQTDIGIIVIEQINLEDDEEIEVEFIVPFLVQGGIIDSYDY